MPDYRWWVIRIMMDIDLSLTICLIGAFETKIINNASEKKYLVSEYNQ